MMPNRCIDAAAALECMRLAGCCGPVDLLAVAAAAAGAGGAIVEGFGALGIAGVVGVDGVAVGFPAACDLAAAAVLTGSISTDDIQPP